MACEDAEGSSRAVMGFLADRFGMAPLADYTYTFSDEEAYRHLFLVASGLDSMVIGEPQILGQVKDAYQSARVPGFAGPFLDQVFSRAFQVAKRVRTETRIGYNPVSISAMAVELARKIFGEFGRQADTRDRGRGDVRDRAEALQEGGPRRGVRDKPHLRQGAAACRRDGRHCLSLSTISRASSPKSIWCSRRRARKSRSSTRRRSSPS